MMTAPTHPLVADYLLRLRATANRLPADQARELYADIEAHFAAAAAEGQTSDAAVRTLIDRLGSPESLVDEIAPPPPPLAAPGTRPVTARREVTAVVLFLGAEVAALTVFLLPFALIGWVAALILTFLSKLWTSAERTRTYLLLGTGLPVALCGVVAGMMSWRTSSCAQPSGGTVDCSGGGPAWVGVLAIVLFLAYVVAQVRLAHRLMTSATARAAAAPARL